MGNAMDLLYFHQESIRFSFTFSAFDISAFTIV
jgi:hypothetical protein